MAVNSAAQQFCAASVSPFCVSTRAALCQRVVTPPLNRFGFVWTAVFVCCQALLYLFLVKLVGLRRHEARTITRRQHCGRAPATTVVRAVLLLLYTDFGETLSSFFFKLHQYSTRQYQTYSTCHELRCNRVK